MSGTRRRWGLYALTCCGSLLLARGVNVNSAERGEKVETIYPDLRVAADELPEAARRYLQQAFDVLSAPDAAALMAGCAVDAMLKSKGLTKGSVYDRINQAVDEHILTAGMGAWAHSVRLGSNRPRHADVTKPHVSLEEAQRSVEFAEALGDFLFVLAGKITRGIQAAGAVELNGVTATGTDVVELPPAQS